MKQVTPSPKKRLSTVGGLSEEVMLAVYVTAFEQKNGKKPARNVLEGSVHGWILTREEGFSKSFQL